MAYWNIGLWAVGNGLTSTTLVVFLALELDAPRLGLGIGLILAMPQLVGLLPLAAPVLIGRIADRKTFCLCTFMLSGLLLLCLPIMAAPGVFRSAAISLAGLIILWSLHHLMQYMGTVALFSWLADIAPLKFAAAFSGIRRRWWWRAKPQAPGVRLVLVLVDRPITTSRCRLDRLRDSRRRGRVVLIASVIPLWFMPSVSSPLSLWERAG